MKCPNCHDRTHIDVEIGDGFTDNDTRECLICGAVWFYSEAESHFKIIKEGNVAMKKEKSV